MGFITDLLNTLMEYASAEVYNVTLIIEKDSVLVGEKKTKKLMTFKQARELVK